MEEHRPGTMMAVGTAGCHWVAHCCGGRRRVIPKGRRWSQDIWKRVGRIDRPRSARAVRRMGGGHWQHGPGVQAPLRTLETLGEASYRLTIGTKGMNRFGPKLFWG
jgi:hypothetical protein